MEDFKSHNIIWGNKTMNKRGQTFKKIINRNNLGQTRLSTLSEVKQPILEDNHEFESDNSSQVSARVQDIFFFV